MTTTPIPFILWPDGSEPLVERFEELTALETSRNGSESRSPLRAFPRYGLAGRFVALRTERDAFAPLRAGQKVLVPTWMHPFPARDGGASPVADALVGNGTGKQFLVKQTTGGSRLLTTTVSNGELYGPDWEPTDAVAYPLVEARLAEDSFTVESVTDTVHITNLSFVAYGVDEPLTYAGPWNSGLPLLEERSDWSVAVQENTAHSANAFDAGHLTEWELRYSKRTVSVLFTLLSRPAVLDFRCFLAATRGRANAFVWPDPITRERKVWRLASDTAELRYYRPSVARCSLKFVEITP